MVTASNQNGFVLSGLCLLLPFLFYVTLAGGWNVWFAQSKEKADYICNDGLLRAQNHLIVASEQVIALNPLAKGLRLAKKALLLARTFILIPKVQIAVRIALRVLRKAQQVLKKVQHQILLKGDILAKKEYFKTHRALKKHLFSMARSWGEKFPSVPTIHYQHRRPQVKVKNKAPAPEYQYKDQYEQKQTLHLKWRLPLRMGFTQTLQIQNQKQQWRGQCKTQPQKYQNQWQSILREVKFL